MAALPPSAANGDDADTSPKRERPFAFVFAICHVGMMDSLRSVLAPHEFTGCEALSFDVRTKLEQILMGEIDDDPTDTLPSIGFLRHCGTPLGNRYNKDMATALQAHLGEQRFKEVQKALNYIF